MYKGKKIAIVVPAYNEEKLIGKVIETIPDYVDKIIVIDDASQDNTAKVVEAYQKSLADRLILIRHDRNKGVGGSIATGYKWARDNEMDISVVMAGDA